MNNHIMESISSNVKHEMNYIYNMGCLSLLKCHGFSHGWSITTITIVFLYIVSAYVQPVTYVMWVNCMKN